MTGVEEAAQVSHELRSDKQAAATIRMTYGLIADAMTAQYDGDRAGMDKAIAQVACDLPPLLRSGGYLPPVGAGVISVESCRLMCVCLQAVSYSSGLR